MKPCYKAKMVEETLIAGNNGEVEGESENFGKEDRKMKIMTDRTENKGLGFVGNSPDGVILTNLNLKRNKLSEISELILQNNGTENNRFVRIEFFNTIKYFNV